MRIIPTLASLCLLPAVSFAQTNGTTATNPPVPPVIGGQWQEQNDGKGKSDLMGVVDLDGTLLAVGKKGAYQTSTDKGATWSASPTTLNIDGEDKPIKTYNFFDIRAYGSRLVLVGQPKILLVSDDNGATWSDKMPTVTGSFGLQASASLTDDYSDIIAVGGGGAVLESTNGGDTFEKVASGNGGAYNAIAGSDSVFVAVGVNGVIMTRGAVADTTTDPDPDDGTDDGTGTGTGTGTTPTTPEDPDKWIVRKSGTTYELRGVTWTGSAFVAVGLHGTVVTSSDGITWTLVQVGDTTRQEFPFLTDVISYGNTIFTCGVTVNSPSALRGSNYSTDGGKTWAACTATNFNGTGVFPTSQMQRLAMGKDGFFAVGNADETWFSDGSFEFWIAKSGATATGEKDDPDGDAISNVMEWIQGLDPTVAATTAQRAFLPVITSSAGVNTITFSFPAALPNGVTIDIQRSTDLKTWSAVTKPFATLTGSADWVVDTTIKPAPTISSTVTDGVRKTTLNLGTLGYFRFRINR